MNHKGKGTDKIENRPKDSLAVQITKEIDVKKGERLQYKLVLKLKIAKENGKGRSIEALCKINSMILERAFARAEHLINKCWISNLSRAARD